MHNPLEQFEIHPIIELHLFGYDISFTNSSLFMTFAFLVIFAFVMLSVCNIKLIPGRMQAVAEMFFNMVNDMVIGTSGKKAEKFVPFILSLFAFILTANLLGMIPYSFTVTSHLAVTFGLAIFIFLGVTIIGIVKHGVKFLELFLPSGTPILMAPLMIFIELFAYLARPISLSVRLAANMTAGHIILKILASMIIMSSIFIKVLPFALLTVLTGFEFFIAALQAYIFTILTCVYLNDALNLH